jgi:hypothetical protein
MFDYAQGSGSSGTSSLPSSVSLNGSLEDTDLASDTLQSVPSRSSSSLEPPKPRSNSQLGPRKGHKKSRGGCFSCKRRKIKVGRAFLFRGSCLPYIVGRAYLILSVVLSLYVVHNEAKYHIVSRNTSFLSQLPEEEP